eukprot:2643911-Lingulodinium_polyedra.AAC.1
MHVETRRQGLRQTAKHLLATSCRAALKHETPRAAGRGRVQRRRTRGGSGKRQEARGPGCELEAAEASLARKLR